MTWFTLQLLTKYNLLKCPPNHKCLYTILSPITARNTNFRLLLWLLKQKLFQLLSFFWLLFCYLYLNYGTGRLCHYTANLFLITYLNAGVWGYTVLLLQPVLLNVYFKFGQSYYLELQASQLNMIVIVFKQRLCSHITTCYDLFSTWFDEELNCENVLGP